MKTKLKILRQASVESEPEWKTYKLQVEPEERLLDALLKIRRNVEPELAFRSNCKSGQCGADAMNINGQPRLACRTLFKDLANPKQVTIRPLDGYRVLKDLVVDLKEVEQLGGEIIEKSVDKLTSPKRTNSEIREAASCNLCGACVPACPVTWNNNLFPGPAALLKSYRLLGILSHEDKNRQLENINRNWGLWGCETDYNCLEVCPREINVTELISRLKREISSGEERCSKVE